MWKYENLGFTLKIYTVRYCLEKWSEDLIFESFLMDILNFGLRSNGQLGAEAVF